MDSKHVTIKFIIYGKKNATAELIGHPGFDVIKSMLQRSEIILH